MKRKIYNDLLEWKLNNNKKPMMLLGVRQSGKTYIIKKFCEENFKNFIEINLFDRQDIVDFYKEKLTSDEKYEKLKYAVNFDLDADETVLFIDEIQESEELISELKYFCENHNNLRIICAGSLLGVKLKRSHFSFPVGKVWIKYLYPMDFEEFLWANDEYDLLDEIKKCFNNNTQMISFMHEKALNYYRLYLITGGMPESVQNMLDVNNDLLKYNYDILKSITESYLNDMNKYVENKNESLKISKIYKSIPLQLANLSKKFQYSKIDNNARTRDFETSLDWLLASNMIIKSTVLLKPSIPPELYKKEDIFKLYISDVGILNNLLDSKYNDIYLDNLGENKGIITENYVAMELMSKGYNLYYWKHGNDAEVDFVIYSEDGLIPIEVKSSENTQAKSLKVYIDKYEPKYAIRISTKNFGFDKRNNIKSVPLYATFLI